MAEKGTLNVIKQALDAGIRHISVASSVGSAINFADPTANLTEKGKVFKGYTDPSRSNNLQTGILRQKRSLLRWQAIPLCRCLHMLPLKLLRRRRYGSMRRIMLMRTSRQVSNFAPFTYWMCIETPKCWGCILWAPLPLLTRSRLATLLP